MTTISYFPPVRRPICMQSGNTKAQTARRCLEQIPNIQAIVEHMRRAPQAVSEAERRLGMVSKAFNEVNNVIKEHQERVRNANEACGKAFMNMHLVQWDPRNPSRKDLAEARDAYVEAEAACDCAYRDRSKAKEKANYFAIERRMRKAEAAVQLAKDQLEQAKHLFREARSSLKTEPPTLQGRCIETICGALLPICTETDLENLPIPPTLQSNIATFCDCLYLIQAEQ